MKITVDIDCTPQEARTFLGLPEVEKMQEVVMKELQAKMLENITNLDPENMMKTWLPAGMQGFDQMQKIFWSQFNKNENEEK
ncbi:DUF6489 family protein [Sneathiella litorea]|uniref:Ribosomal protein S1 n=1 Tax=Sneathiella litorea TaxID=2606216 RepID=A0A6L8W5M0_9PROT|nr:DUF6489 family protein [Sneathiella litorea]MZR29792.1 hypothetical protein [Sneathiella litorea]